MKRFFLNLGLVLAMTMAFSMFSSSCSNDDDDNDGTISGIPADSKATPNPTIEDNNTVMPNVQYTVEKSGDYVIIRLDMTGVQDVNNIDWLKLYGTGLSNQNVWVEVDGVPKGIVVINSDENDDNRKRLTDIVFTVDNSGSMSDEANGLARDILEWASKLNSSLDARFGVVGYGRRVGSEYAYLRDNYGISGALNLTTKEDLNSYLNRSGISGVDRTVGYSGSDASKLSSYASDDAFYRAGGECGAQAIKFADTYFSFRNGANRIYVNFTDDANYTGGNSDISVECMRPEKWSASKGTIHSVISSTETDIQGRVKRVGNSELPWLMSEYTGGSILFVSPNFSGVTLESLPVTGALQNSYIIRFTNINPLMDGNVHQVKITIVSGNTRVERIFYINFGTL